MDMFLRAPVLSAQLTLFVFDDAPTWAWLEVAGEPLWPVVIGRA